jgi:hypothetical protein
MEQLTNTRKLKTAWLGLNPRTTGLLESACETGLYEITPSRTAILRTRTKPHKFITAPRLTIIVNSFCRISLKFWLSPNQSADALSSSKWR